MMARSHSKSRHPRFRDNDSGIGLDYNYSSSSEFNSSKSTLNAPFEQYQSTTVTFPISGIGIRKRTEKMPLIRFPWDGGVERIRPATMRNSENSDFIICQNNRGAFIACRTPIVPEWVTKLVNQIEAEQR